MNKSFKKKWFFYKILAVAVVMFFVAFLRYCSIAKLFCAQSGSIFEIAKIAFWAMFAYGLLEFLIPSFAEQDNIFFAKLTAIVLIPFLITIFILILPDNFWGSLLAVGLTIIISQIAEMLLVRVQPNCISILIVTLLFLIFFVSFIIFTYHPLGGVVFKK